MPSPRGESWHEAGRPFGGRILLERIARADRLALRNDPAGRFETEILDRLIGEQMPFEIGVGRRKPQHDRPLNRGPYEVGAILSKRDDFGDDRDCSLQKASAAPNAPAHANNRTPCPPTTKLLMASRSSLSIAEVLHASHRRQGPHHK